MCSGQNIPVCLQYSWFFGLLFCWNILSIRSMLELHALANMVGYIFLKIKLDSVWPKDFTTISLQGVVYRHITVGPSNTALLWDFLSALHDRIFPQPERQHTTTLNTNTRTVHQPHARINDIPSIIFLIPQSHRGIVFFSWHCLGVTLMSESSWGDGCSWEGMTRIYPSPGITFPIVWPESISCMMLIRTCSHIHIMGRIMYSTFSFVLHTVLQYVFRFFGTSTVYNTVKHICCNQM